MANSTYGGLPPLNTEYGPNYAQVAAAAQIANQAKNKNALQQAMQGYTPGGGVGQNAVKAALMADPATGVHIANLESQMGKRDHDAEAKAIDVKTKALEYAGKTLPLLKGHPERWTPFVQNLRQMGVPSTFFDVDLSQLPPDQFDAALGKLEDAFLKPEERARLNTPAYHTFEEGDTKRTIAQLPGKEATTVATAPRNIPQASTAPMHVQDPNSPTGWSYADLLGNVTPGAPAPSSDTNIMDPFKANQRISAIQKDRTALAGSLEKLKKGDIITNALAQFMGRPELAGTTATDDMVTQLNDAYQKANTQWDNEVKLLEPYAKAAPAQKPGERSISKGQAAAQPTAAKTAGTQPQYIRNKTTGEVRKWNPATKQYEAI